MPCRTIRLTAALALAFFSVQPTPSQALPADVLKSVVSVLPVWPGRSQGGTGSRPGTAPEGSGIILEPGHVVTAWHVVEPARRIDIRLSDGRIFPAQLIAKDVASDIAVLGVDGEFAPIEIAPTPQIAEPVCAVGNAYGLGLSVTCGVVSALHVTNAGFNAVEDFVQTDAAANPGSSGGALVDEQGRLVGMMSAIFASDGDNNIGINFAVSVELLQKVFRDLVSDGEVRYLSPGWRLGTADRESRASVAAPVVFGIDANGPAADADLSPGDLILKIGSRRIQTPRDAVSALAVIPDPGTPVDITVMREGRELVSALLLDDQPEPADRVEPDVSQTDCPHPRPVCRVRQAVFPVSSFDPIASATRIGGEMVVTNRHVIAGLPDAIVHTPDGPRNARVIPSAYDGDLVLLEVSGLPASGLILDPAKFPLDNDATYFAIGADVARRQVRVFEPGALIAGPAEGADLGRLHVSSRMQPGVSGGALVNERGVFAGIAVGGGDERFEAIPVDDVVDLLALRTDESATDVTRRLGMAFSDCVGLMEAFAGRSASDMARTRLQETCATARNHGQLLEAGRLLAHAGDFDGAIALHGQAAEQVPNSINARMSLLVSLQLSGRFDEMTGHARWLMEMAPEDPQSLRFAIQSGVWGGEPELAEKAYQLLEKVNPRQAEAARRFIENAPPAPVRR